MNKTEQDDSQKLSRVFSTEMQTNLHRAHPLQTKGYAERTSETNSKNHKEDFLMRCYPL